jgi:hypothetical protein
MVPMTVQALPGAPSRVELEDSDGLPEAVAGWSVTRIPAGLWLSATDRSVSPDALALKAEPGRAALVIDAPGPDQHTDALMAELLPMLARRGRSVRIVLSAADRYTDLSWAYGLEFLVAETAVTLTPHGYAVVRSPGLMPQGRLPQWRRCLPGGDQQPAGVLAPSPPWEQQLDVSPMAPPGQRLTVRRVPAGLVLGTDPRDSLAAQVAGSVWPDPDRVTVVIGEAVEPGAALDGLAELLPLLPLRSSDGVRLHWPRAASGDTGAALGELAVRCGTDLIAPAADVSVTGYGGVCHGPAGAAPWLLFSRRGDAQVLSSLYPEPGWEDVLAGADFSDLDVDQVAAGLCVCPPGPAARGLAATARSILPALAGPTIIVGGDAGNSHVRQDVETVLGRIPARALRVVRILLTGAAAGGHDSYAQFLADTFGFKVAAPAGRWTASPGGVVRVLPVASPAGSGEVPGPWLSFAPRDKPPRQAPSLSAPEPAVPADAPKARAVVEVLPSGAAAQEAPGPAAPSDLPGSLPVLEAPPPDAVAPEPAAPPDVPEVLPVVAAPPSSEVADEAPAATRKVVLASRDHRSSAQERRQYHESAGRYQTYLVAVRRVLTQRPGLRSAVSADGEEAVVTDFAAVLDFLAGDQRSIAAALRSPGGGPDPRALCAISGLRRLPSFTGPVFTSASVPPQMAVGYVPGRTLIEPAFVYASSASRVLLKGNVEYVIWSQTGKRAAALAPDFGGDEIVFAAGTTYKVLEASVEAEVAGPGSALVFLRESAASSPTAGQPGELDESDRQVLDRLVAAVAERGGVAPEDRVGARLAGGSGQPVGLDAEGSPYGE